MSLASSWQRFFDKPAPNMALRVVVMFLGVVVMAASISLTRATGLGTSPISCVPATLSYMTPLTIGTWTFILNVLFVLVQIALLRREFQPIQLLQIPAVLIFSLVVDFFVPYCEMLPMPTYFACFAWNLAGCFLTALGVFLTVKASLLTLPGEGIVLSIAHALRAPFPKCKMAFDSSMVAIAAILSITTMGGLYGVREGTIVSALLVGAIVGLYGKMMPRFDVFCPLEGHPTFVINAMARAAHDDEEEKNGASDRPLVITVSRQFGSGGREIGQIVGKKLGIPVFDESLIELVSRESGLTPDYVREHEEEVKRGVLYNLYLQNYQTIGSEPDQHDRLWIAQARTITRLVDAGACVIVGRCANALTSRRGNVFNVFVHAPIEARVERVMRRDGMGREEALGRIDAIDRERAEHCRRYTGTAWGQAADFHLSIDSSLQDPSRTAELICSLARRAFPESPPSPNPEKPSKR